MEKGTPTPEFGQSISFGRFTSESLAWEKWSTFSHNKYVEEAEKFSRPGSVAQMKAFFEAHYRNLAARKAAEAANAAAAAAAANNSNDNDNSHHPEHVDGVVLGDNATQCSQAETDGQVGIVKETTLEATIVLDENNTSVEMGVEQCIERGNMDEVHPLTENQAFVDDCVEVESLSHFVCTEDKEEPTELELIGSKQMEMPLLKDFISNKYDEMVSASKRKSAASTSKSLVSTRASKTQSSPAKPAALVRTRKETSATPMSKKSVIECLDKRKPTPKSTHKSMNFTPVKEINRITSSIIRKIDCSRVSSHPKSSKGCSTPLRTTTTVTVQVDNKQTLATPPPENTRASTPLHPLASGSKTTRARWNFLPTGCSKFMTAGRNKTQSPSISSPFNLRTEERAARRKEKLEEKFNADQAKTVQLQATLKEKAGAELKKLRQTLCFKARPLPDFYKERVASKDQLEKVPLTHPRSPKKKPAPSTVQKTPQPSLKASIKSSGCKHVAVKHDKNLHAQASRHSSRVVGENTSPNIPHYRGI